MLYLIHRRNEELAYKGGQEPIVHLEADLHRTVRWADANRRRWAFTLSNAGSYYVEGRSNLAQLDEIDWEAVYARQWAGSGVPSSVKDGKQAEFLIEFGFPWHLVERIGVYSPSLVGRVSEAMGQADYRPRIEIRREWYY